MGQKIFKDDDAMNIRNPPLLLRRGNWIFWFSDQPRISRAGRTILVKSIFFFLYTIIYTMHLFKLPVSTCKLQYNRSVN